MSSCSWLKTIQNAKKTAVIENGQNKVHYLFEDGEEMIEYYNMDTNVVVRRMWKKKSIFGADIGWDIEVGDPEPKQYQNDDPESNIETAAIQENSSVPFITKRITKRSLEWRIRNLPYPENVYSVTAEHDGTITVHTSNKKYFKKIHVPDLERIGLKLEQERISFMHQYNTLIITYKKPPELLNVENEILKILQLEAQSTNVQCPIN